MGVQNLVVNVTTGLIVPTARPDCAFLKCETPPGTRERRATTAAQRALRV